MSKLRERFGLVPVMSLPAFVGPFVYFGLMVGPIGILGLLLLSKSTSTANISRFLVLWCILSLVAWKIASQSMIANASKTAAAQTSSAEAEGGASCDEGPSSQSGSGVIGEPSFCPNLMSGQLVARYKQTHDTSFQTEYLRRLDAVGFDANQAHALFIYELMILKHDAVERLCRDDYLQATLFNLEAPTLAQDDAYYVEHQSFLCSEIVKLWDEAEWHYWHSHEREGLPDKVWAEIFRLSRHSGAKLYLSYLSSVAEHAHLPLELVHAYCAAEQQLIFAYKWNAGKGERHPYPLDRF